MRRQTISSPGFFSGALAVSVVDVAAGGGAGVVSEAGGGVADVSAGGGVSAAMTALVDAISANDSPTRRRLKQARTGMIQLP
jgi:hypothetical protein